MQENNKAQQPGAEAPGQVKQPENTTPPEDNGTPAGKTFTQDEVNKIISERLARERVKAEPDPIEERERDLIARENVMTCKEFLREEGYKDWQVDALMDLFDASNADSFKEKVAALASAFSIDPKAPQIVISRPGNHHPSGGFDPIAEAFKRKDN